MCLRRQPLPIPEDLGDEHQRMCRDFVDKIRLDNGITLHPFDLNEWGAGAESTLLQSNRRTRHPRLSSESLAAVTSQVWKILSEGQPHDFDCSFFKLAFTIRQAHLPFMTFGRTQKFINMLCKYAYCYYWSGIDPAWNAANGWVRALSPCFHIPVDGIVLYNLRKTDNPDWFKKLITTPVRQAGRGYARFRHGSAAEGWSVLDRTYPYVAVQQYVLDNLRGAVTPMHREMRDLWS